MKLNISKPNDSDIYDLYCIEITDEMLAYRNQTSERLDNNMVFVTKSELVEKKMSISYMNRKTYILKYDKNSVFEFNVLEEYALQYNNAVFYIKQGFVTWCQLDKNLDTINIPMPEMKLIYEETEKSVITKIRDLKYSIFNSYELRLKNNKKIFIASKIGDGCDNVCSIIFDNKRCSNKTSLLDAIVDYCKKYVDKREKV